MLLLRRVDAVSTHTETPIRTPAVQNRLCRELPGYIWQHRETGKLVGVVSCDEGQWLEVMDEHGWVTERHFTDITNYYDQVQKGRLRAVCAFKLDTHGEFPIQRRVWGVLRGELLLEMREFGRVAA